MTVDGEVLTLNIDLSKEFGPSKSGKTIIVASTEGNKSVPGRTEKVGLNIYRQEAKKPGKGRKNSFKNVEMDMQGDVAEDHSGPVAGVRSFQVGEDRDHRFHRGKPARVLAGGKDRAQRVPENRLTHLHENEGAAGVRGILIVSTASSRNHR